MSVEYEAMDSMPVDDLEPGSLLDMPLRVWAEIGRTRMPAAYVVGMPEGAIVDLDTEPDDPADLFVNGRHYGTGRLVLVDGEWALRVETLVDDGQVDESADGEVDADVEQPSSDAEQSTEAAD